MLETSIIMFLLNGMEKIMNGIMKINFLCQKQRNTCLGVCFTSITQKQRFGQHQKPKWALLLLLIPTVDKVDGCTPKTVPPTKYCFLAKLV